MDATPARPVQGRDHPGRTLGLPASGRGSLASWRARLAALLIDWAASMLVAVGAFGITVMTGHDWRSWMILAVFFVQRAVLTTLVGGSFGQLLARIAVVRLDGEPVGWLGSVVRAAMKCLVIPAVVIGAERRGLDDLMLGTVVVNRVGPRSG